MVGENPSVNGIWEVVVARYGRRTTRRSEVFLGYDLYGEPDGSIGMDYFVWVVRSGETTIVVDTGFSRVGGESRGREMLVEPATLFDQLGVDRAACTVVVTHGHYDHIGNLELFPDAEVIVARREVEFWSGPLRGKALFRHSVEESEIDRLSQVADQPRSRLIDDALQIAPGVDVIVVGGHTPGQCVVRVRTAEGTVLLASDAVHYYEELERDMPFSSAVDLGQMYNALERIRAMVASGDVDIVVSGHDPATLRRLRPAISPDEHVVVLGGAA